MDRTAQLNVGNYYQFTLDKDQKVTLDLMKNARKSPYFNAGIDRAWLAVRLAFFIETYVRLFGEI
ncbi:hypothetical protein [Lactobacillus helveticus]|uniref:hypothetical protein n=1 Tax=Lactobacillus helveticus TaxID=1587 RepID=UPI00156304B3|nr:hypothetical protein [Lactobacillus helveticus]